MDNHPLTSSSLTTRSRGSKRCGAQQASGPGQTLCGGSSMRSSPSACRTSRPGRGREGLWGGDGELRLLVGARWRSRGGNQGGQPPTTLQNTPEMPWSEPLTSMSSLSPSSFFPFILATFWSSFKACWDFPTMTIQRADSVNHLGRRGRAGASHKDHPSVPLTLPPASHPFIHPSTQPTIHPANQSSTQSSTHPCTHPLNPVPPINATLHPPTHPSGCTSIPSPSPPHHE